MPGDRLTPEEFVQRWEGRELSERAASQGHFIDLCRMLGVPAPTDNPVTDSDYGFEARTNVSATAIYPAKYENGTQKFLVTTSSGTGFVDVWKRDHFCWEYKRRGKHSTLEAALAQARAYKDSLGNPPLLIVSDVDRYEIHTNFTNYPPTAFKFTINELIRPSAEWKKKKYGISPFEALKKVFDDPEWFRPKKTITAITEELASEIGKLAISLRDAGNDPQSVAHFVMQIVFCLFAEDIGLLPKDVFKDILAKSIDKPKDFPAKARRLFKAMEKGGTFGSDTIEWFNGGLYRDISKDPIINLASPWLGKLLIVANADWSSVEPSIMGTLFERSLDPGKRSQIGAHYTSREDIMLIVEPVVMAPLRKTWHNVQKDIAEWVEQREQKKSKQAKVRLNKKIEKALVDYVGELGSVRILDPACGSGNFLYVAIQQLLDLESQVRAFAATPEIQVPLQPRVHPTQLFGIDINLYAAELARVSIWVGYLQWLHQNGSSPGSRPILDPLDTIECRDAILKWTDNEGHQIPEYKSSAKCEGKADWPAADFIIGNPPFLGDKLLRRGLGDDYVEALWRAFDSSIPRQSDLCCYWFEQARSALAHVGASRIGLLATQNIRGGASRRVLDRIKRQGDIFRAISDKNWMLEGASVHVSIIAFDGGQESSRFLDGVPVSVIHSDLSSGSDASLTEILNQNEKIGFLGSCKGGPFDISFEEASKLLSKSGNPHGRQNSDVLRPVINSRELLSRGTWRWIIDNADLELKDASLYEAPHRIVESRVKPIRIKNRDRWLRENWWRPQRMRPELRAAVSNLSRFLVTPTTSKHRTFVWLTHPTLPDHQLVAYAREDDYFLGVVHSSIHELWARSMGTQLREAESGFRYTPTTCFETFPLPWPPGQEQIDNESFVCVSNAAIELNELRENWLNPPDWIKQIKTQVDSFEDFSDVPDDTRNLIRQSAIMAYAAKDKRLKKRTLTNLYNERPSWLKLAHKKLDEAVIRAYAEVDPKGEWDPAWAEVYEPFGAGEIVITRPEDVKGKRKKPDTPSEIAAKEEAIERRKEVDEKILANLLRLNQQRARKQPAE